MPWYTHAPTFADPDTGAFSEDFKGIVENFPAMARGENGSPYVEAGWHPYDGVTVGDGADGVIYDFAVDGALGSVETPDFADGYEYMIIGRGLSDQQSGQLRFDWWRETSAAWTGYAIIDRPGLSGHPTYDLKIEAFAPRAVSNFMFFNLASTDVAPANDMTALVNYNQKLALTTAQKIGKARLTLTANTFAAGKIYMFKRRCFV